MRSAVRNYIGFLHGPFERMTEGIDYLFRRREQAALAKRVHQIGRNQLAFVLVLGETVRRLLHRLKRNAHNRDGCEYVGL